MKIIISLVFMLHLAVCYGKILPKELSPLVCHRSNPKINECLLENGNQFIPLLAKGYPDIKIPPFDPLELEFMTAEGEAESVQIKMAMKNITLHGLANSRINKVKFDPETLSGEVTLTTPYSRMTTSYTASGRLFAISLNSSANFDGNMTDTDWTVTFNLKTKQKKGVDYFTIDKMQAKMHVGSAQIKLNSINPDQQPAADIIEKFFNENDRLVLDTVNPIVNLELDKFWIHIITRYIRVLPANELLPK